MNISIIIFSLGGGAGRVAVNIANEFHRSGHTVILVYGASKEGLDKELYTPAVYLRSKGLVDFAGKVFLDRKSLASTTVVFEPVLGALLTTPLKLSRSKRKIAWRILTDPVQSLQANRSYLRRVFKKYFLRLSATLADHVIANSQGSAGSFRFICPRYPEHKISTIYNPITGLSNRSHSYKDSIREKLNLPQECRVIVAAGRLTRQKGFDVLLEAYAQAINTLQEPSHLVIFGEGPDRKSLEGLAATLGVTDSVSFYGHSNKFENYLPQADLFVLSSRYEGFGNVLVEALAANVPIVSTDCPSGPSEILENGKYGLLVPPEDPEALSQGISHLLNAGKNGFAQGTERAKDFSVSIIVKQYENVLTGLSSNRSDHTGSE